MTHPDPSPLYRLAIRETTHHRVAAAARGWPPPDSYDRESTVSEYHLLAQPPDRWLQWRDVHPGARRERNRIVVNGQDWWWFQSDDAVEHGNASVHPAPVSQYLFDAAALVAECETETDIPTTLLGRPARVIEGRPRPDTPRASMGGDRCRITIDNDTRIVLRHEDFYRNHAFLTSEVTALDIDHDPTPGMFDPAIDSRDVVYEHGTPSPGVLVSFEHAARRAQRWGFDLALPNPLPPGASARFWLTPPSDQQPSSSIRVQIDLASGRNVVLLQRADDGTPCQVVKGGTCVEVGGTATSREMDAVMTGLTPVAAH